MQNTLQHGYRGVSFLCWLNQPRRKSWSLKCSRNYPLNMFFCTMHIAIAIHFLWVQSSYSDSCQRNIVLRDEQICWVDYHHRKKRTCTHTSKNTKQTNSYLKYFQTNYQARWSVELGGFLAWYGLQTYEPSVNKYQNFCDWLANQ